MDKILSVWYNIPKWVFGREAPNRSVSNDYVEIAVIPQ